MTIARHIAAATLLLGGVAAGTARAAETTAPPAHLAAYNLDWLNYIAPSDLPPSRYATCIVDTGTLVTLDTPEASPDGPILDRLATDGGPGTPQGADPKQLHGTQMAMAAIAPVNDWGTVGATTWGRVVTVRAQTDNELGFRQDAYRKGVDGCQEAAGRVPIASVSLSLGCECSVGAGEEARLIDAIEAARQVGISTVAAAGNDAGAGTATPARLPDVFAVAAGSTTGTLCSYGSFDDQVDVLGPACPVEVADPLTGAPVSAFGGGSSTATVLTATLLSALRTLRPDATPQHAESWIRDAARTVDGRRVLDGAAAARLAGLGPVLDRSRARMPEPAPSPQTAPPASPAASAATPEPPTGSATPSATPDGDQPRPTRPRAPGFERRTLTRPRAVRARWNGRHLFVSARGRRGDAELQVIAEQVGELGLASRRTRRSAARHQLTLPLRWRPDRVVVRFVSRREFGPQASRTRILHRTRSGRFK